MKAATILKQQNRELRDPDWWQTPRYRVHPERQIRTPLVRSSAQQAIAQAFFSEVARDPELLVRRTAILLQWHTQQRHRHV